MEKGFLDRRTFLKGAGVTMALPVMEANVSKKHLQRTGSKVPVKRFVCLSNNYGVYQKAFFPSVSDQGSGYKMPETLASCLLYTSPSPRDKRQSRMPSSA